MRSPCLMLLIAAAAAREMTGETVGTASRTLSLNPEEIVIELLVDTPADTTVDQAVAGLASLRVTQVNLESVGTVREAPDRLAWQYVLLRPYTSLFDVLKEISFARRQLREAGFAMTYQFFFRPALKTVDAAKRRVLTELIREARQNAKATGKVRSVMIEPSPQTLNSWRAAPMFGRSSGSLQLELNLVAVFDDQ